jgi:hypothetical protein
LLEQEEIIKRAIRVLRSECGESQAIVNNVDTMFAELHEALDGLVTLPEDLMGLPQDMDRIVSIQVQTTRLTGAGVEMVPFKDQHIKPTHWSIYKRDAAGMAHWIEDIELKGAQADVVWGQVMVKATKYSQVYSAFIEQVK